MEHFVPLTSRGVALAIQGAWGCVLFHVSNGGLGADSLCVLDVTQPTAPAVTRRLAMQAPAVNVIIKGDYAYVAEVGSFTAGVEVVDLGTGMKHKTLLTAPTVLATRAGLAVVNETLYYATDQLWPIDISNPAALQVGTPVPAPAQAREAVAIGSSRLATNGNKLTIWDVSAPSTPSILTSFPGAVGSLAAVGTRVYAFSSSAPGLLVLDSNSLAAGPRSIAEFQSQYILDLEAVDGQVAMSTLEASPTEHYRFSKLDVTNTAEPHIGEGLDILQPALDAYLEGRVIGLTSTAAHVLMPDGLSSFSLEHAAGPTAPAPAVSSVAPAIALTHGRAYTQDAVTGALLVSGISDSGVLTLLGSTTQVNGGADAMLASGGWVYLGYRNGPLKIVNAQDPTNLVVHTFNLESQSLAVADSLLLCTKDGSTTILNIANPATPAMRGSFSHEPNGTTAIQGHYFCVYGGKIQLFDVSHPDAVGAPWREFDVPFDGAWWGVFRFAFTLRMPFAYVGTPSGLGVVDLSPVSPVGHIVATPGGISEVGGAGRGLYARSAADGFLWSFDTAQPDAPRVTGHTAWLPGAISTSSGLALDCSVNLFVQAPYLYVVPRECSLEPGCPVPVVLSDFRAHREGRGVVLAWHVATELAGRTTVHVERATGELGPYEELIGVESSPEEEILDPAPVATAAWYRLRAVGVGGADFYAGPVAVDALRTAELEVAAFVQNAHQVMIQYTTRDERDIQLEVFNVAGARIRTLDRGVRKAGDHSLTWDCTNQAGTRVARGVYVVRLVAGSQVSTKIVILEP